MWRLALFACMGLVGPGFAAGSVVAAPVVLISIDGLMPESYVAPDKLGLGIPNLRRLVAEGAHAVGATSVLPSVTFPSHTTMITGVNPNRHGIYTNDVFDPDGTYGSGWYWYYEEIKAPNLFGVLAAAGLKTATVTWPVTAGAPIDLNLPDMYPVANLREAKNLASLARTPKNAAIMNEVLPAARALVHMKDDLRARAAVRFLREKPDFLAVHFLELDDAEHQHGPRSPEALSTLERIDAYVGEVLSALRDGGRYDETTVALVSDHGFVRIEKEIRINALLRTLGLFATDARGRIQSWRAFAAIAGGTTAIYLHPDASADDRRKVDDAVRLLLSNPAYGVGRSLRSAELAGAGGFAGAYVVLEAQPPFAFSRVLDPPDLVAPTGGSGTHGYLPQRPEMRASFILRGPKIKRGKDLGVVRLLDVAPTLARVLGVDLGAVEGRVLGEAFEGSATTR